MNVTSDLPATVLSVDVATGDRVEPGTTLVVLESMKLEIPVDAEFAGTVTEIRVSQGDLVEEGSTLLVIEA